MFKEYSFKRRDIMKKKIIIFTKEELKRLNLKRINNYYILHKKQNNIEKVKKSNAEKLH